MYSDWAIAMAVMSITYTIRPASIDIRDDAATIGHCTLAEKKMKKSLLSDTDGHLPDDTAKN